MVHFNRVLINNEWEQFPLVAGSKRGKYAVKTYFKPFMHIFHYNKIHFLNLFFLYLDINPCVTGVVIYI